MMNLSNFPRERLEALLESALEIICKHGASDDFIGLYPDDFDECFWCAESGEPWIHPMADMSGFRDEDLGGRLCKSCAECAANEGSGE